MCCDFTDLEGPLCAPGVCTDVPDAQRLCANATTAVTDFASRVAGIFHQGYPECLSDHEMFLGAGDVFPSMTCLLMLRVDTGKFQARVKIRDVPDLWMHCKDICKLVDDEEDICKLVGDDDDICKFADDDEDICKLASQRICPRHVHGTCMLQEANRGCRGAGGRWSSASRGRSGTPKPSRSP